MQVVTTLDEINRNMRQLSDYLYSSDAAEREFARELIRNGRCFLVQSSDNVWFFGPSRFVGYVQNTLATHSDNEDKDGKETNPAITTILLCPPSEDASLDDAYREYCKRLTISVREYPTATRKYWRISSAA